MKASQVAEANRLLLTEQHSANFLEAMKDQTLAIQAGGITITISPEDPQRPLLEQAVTDFVGYLQFQAKEKLEQFDLEKDEPEVVEAALEKVSDLTGFPEDDEPAPVDPA
jgi:hypothetical protein